jgi:hypothetical protein
LFNKIKDERNKDMKKNYVIDDYGNKRPTPEMINAYIDQWGDDAKHGYAVCDFDCTGMLEIEMIGEMEIFDGDEEAVEQAIKDGIKIIPVNELPDNFDRDYLGWIDTPENRKAIEDYCSDEGNYYVNGHSI